MQRTLLVLCCLSLTFGSVSCGNVRDQVADLRGSAATLPEQARFCLAVVRTVHAVEANTPKTAAEAAEEVVSTAPANIAADARELVDAARETVEGDGGSDQTALIDAADQLREATQPLCDSR